jgi:6-phosphofructokinase 1
MEELRKRTEYKFRACVLGHIQRGGSPVARDRINASRIGADSVNAAKEGETGVMVGLIHGKRALTPFEETWTTPKPPDASLLEMNRVLSI